MPIDENGMGHSPYTRQKQEQFRLIIRAWLRIVKGCLSRSYWADQRFHYIDLTAGCGYCDGMPGSPMIFMDEAERLNVRYQATFIDSNQENCNQLENQAELLGRKIRVICADNREALSTLTRENGRSRTARYGLIYWDANGASCLPAEELRAFLSLRCNSYLDFMGYLSATSRKRCIGAGLPRPRLMEDLEDIGKKHIHLRQPSGRHQWTFALCTNWQEAPEFSTLGFHRVETRAGQEVKDLLNLTNAERMDKNGQQDFFAESRPTEPMPSICGTPNLFA